MDSMQRRLEEARTRLLDAQACLVTARRLRVYERGWERKFCEALDRAWEAQCMAQGSL